MLEWVKLIVFLYNRFFSIVGYLKQLGFNTIFYLTIGAEHVALAGKAGAAGIGGSSTRHRVGDAEASPPTVANRVKYTDQRYSNVHLTDDNNLIKAIT